MSFDERLTAASDRVVNSKLDEERQGYIKEGKRLADEGFTSEESKEARKNHPSNSYLTSYLNFQKLMMMSYFL